VACVDQSDAYEHIGDLARIENPSRQYRHFHYRPKLASKSVAYTKDLSEIGPIFSGLDETVGNVANCAFVNNFRVSVKTSQKLRMDALNTIYFH